MMINDIMMRVKIVYN